MLSGSTRVAAVIGHPVAHSLSPVIHNAAFAALGLDWAFVAFDVAPGEGEAAVAAARTLGLGGLSVTMPHKDAAARAVDRCAPDAAALGAVNCVVPRPDGTLTGENTDGPGFLDALAADLGVSADGRRCVVLGAGGAARAVVLALAGAGATEVVVVNRSTDRAVAAASLAPGVARVGMVEEAGGAELVVNATSVGMDGETSPLPAGTIGSGQIVVDLVYHPAETPLLAEAAAAGAAVANGLGMLVHQAGHAFRHWTGEAAPVAVMAEAVRGHLSSPGH